MQIPQARSDVLLRSLLAIGTLTFATACAESLAPTAPSEPSEPEVPSQPSESTVSLERISSDTISGFASFPTEQALRVRAVGSDGAGQSEVAVLFSAEDGAGSVLEDTVTTDSDGYASTGWTLGPNEGLQKATARLTSGGAGDVVFFADASYGGATSIEVLSSSNGLAPVGCPVPAPFEVRVIDAAGQPAAGQPVRFSSADSDNERVVMTDAAGIAGVEWIPVAGAEQIMATVARPGISAELSVQAVPVAPGGYATVGNQIIGPDCTEHRFYGAARPGLQSWPNDARLQDPALAREEFTGMARWGANIVRIPLYQRYWQRSMTYDGASYTPTAYKALIRQTVDLALESGLAVILDLHNSDRGDPDYPILQSAIQQMADVQNSVPFWEDLAAEYGDEGQVIFQLYTEPNQIDWDLWRNGGFVPEGDTYPPESSGVGFQAAGMQQLYDAVRDAGADNLVVINGMHWGYNLTGIPEYAIDGYNIVYATHPYDYPDKQPESWEADWGFLTDTYPVMIAEFGDYKCNADGYYSAVLDYADQKNLSWIAWAWWAPTSDNQAAICGFPALITDWGGEPSPSGEVVRARMQSYAN